MTRPSSDEALITYHRNITNPSYLEVSDSSVLRGLDYIIRKQFFAPVCIVRNAADTEEQLLSWSLRGRDAIGRRTAAEPLRVEAARET